MDDEEWRDILGYEGHYQASSLGRIRCIKPIYSEPRIATLTPDVSGYLVVNLTLAGKRKQCKVHQLVLLAFVGERPDGMFGCHGDNDRANNRASNLRWDTPRANQIDRFRHGTHNRGEQNPMSKLNEEIVRQIKRRLVGSKWGDGPKIAKEFKIHERLVSDIKRGVVWGWVNV